MATDQNLKEQLKFIALVLCVLASSSNLGLLVWKGGALQNDHERLKDRVTSIENGGSRLASEHVKLDDLREKMDNERLVKLEVIVQMLPDLSSKVAVIDTKLDALKTSVDDHRKATGINGTRQ